MIIYQWLYLIFTHKSTPLIEINLRKHWYCDNVCDDHFLAKAFLQLVKTASFEID